MPSPIENGAPESPLLNISEAVKYLRLSQSALYERLDQFELVRLGRRIFITKKSIDAYIAANTRSPVRLPARKRAAAA